MFGSASVVFQCLKHADWDNKAEELCSRLR